MIHSGDILIAVNGVHLLVSDVYGNSCHVYYLKNLSEKKFRWNIDMLMTICSPCTNIFRDEIDWPL